ncbi:MAG: penicillin-binding protein activator, partial [Myxococcota bacterium]|nr:penicillin-binding protein activator [Myxococcota bacterium]
KPTVRLHAGELLRLGGELGHAEEHFRAIKERHPRHASSEGATLGLALIALETSQSGNAKATLKLVGENRAPDTMNADRYRILAVLELEESGEGSKEARYFAERALSFSEGHPQESGRIAAEMAAYFPGLVPSDVLVAGSGPADVHALEQIREALQAGQLDNALQLLERFEEKHPDSPFASTAQWMRRKAEAGNPWNPKRVGVLLPLSGQLAPAGNQIRAGLEQAISDRESTVDLVFMDTAGDPDTAVAATEALLLEQGVSMLIGPLLKDVSFAVSDLAQAAEVPMLSFSQSAGLTERGEWTFRGGITKRHQIRALLDHAMGPAELSRFAILAPDNAYGRDAALEFETQVLEREGSITRTVFYDPAAPDIREFAKDLGQKLDESRRGELRLLRKEAEEEGRDPHKVVLPPVVDFDGIFVPDGATRVPTVASALAYEEFAIGRFRPTDKDQPVPLLGLNGWNDTRLARQGGRYVLDSYFVDAFTLLSESEAHQQFVDGFSETQGRPPGIFEAIAYDVASVVDVALSVGPEDREALRESLAGVNLNTPVTGGHQFDESRELIRDFTVFTVGDDGIEIWQPEEDELPPPPLDQP